MTVFFLRRASTQGCNAGDSGTLRVGLTVGRALGGSVERSRIKRRMREAVRNNWPVTGVPVDVVFNPRKAVLDLPFAEIAKEVARGLQLAVERARVAEDGAAPRHGKQK